MLMDPEQKSSLLPATLLFTTTEFLLLLYGVYFLYKKIVQK
jgi:hypothetical protein